VLVLLVAWFGLPPGTAPAQGRPPEPTVSLSVKDKPLGEVLDQIARATGSDFLMEPSWQKVPVTAYIENAPLSVALKRVLSGLNHAIVYLPQNQIKIVIYEASSPSAAPAPPPSPMGRVPTRAPQPNPPVAPGYVDPMQNAPPDLGGMPPPVPPAEEEPAQQ
jgi:type II secretory pathway component GspD/PulD (secretin)